VSIPAIRITRLAILAVLAIGASACTQPTPPPAVPTLVVTPTPLGLSASGPTALSVSGTGFDASADIVLDECHNANVSGAFCLQLAYTTTAADGSFAATPMTVQYVISPPGYSVPCDTTPSPNTCSIRAIYGSGPHAGALAAETPLSFAGH